MLKRIGRESSDFVAVLASRSWNGGSMTRYRTLVFSILHEALELILRLKNPPAVVIYMCRRYERGGRCHCKVQAIHVSVVRFNTRTLFL